MNSFEGDLLSKRFCVLLSIVDGHVGATLRVDLAADLLGDDVGSNLRREE